MSAVPLHSGDDEEKYLPPITPEIIDTVISSQFPDGLTNRDWKKIKRLARGMRKGVILIEIDEYKAVGFETRKRYDASLDEV